jgi:transcriptional regulator with XRE-family HTH domain
MGMNTFGTYLRTTRKQHGLTINQVGEKIECHPSLISAYEVGKRNPSLRILKKLAPLYDVSFLQLLKMKEEHASDANYDTLKKLAVAEKQIQKYEKTLNTISKIAASGSRQEIRKIATLALYETGDKLIK